MDTAKQNKCNFDAEPDDSKETEFKDSVMKAESIHVTKNTAFDDTESTVNQVSALQFPDTVIAGKIHIGQTKS